MEPYPKRKKLRLQDFDYGQSRFYFVTICTRDRAPVLSRIVGRGLDPAVHAEIELKPFGKIAEQELLAIPQHYPSVEIHNYVVMPDHVHILFSIGCRDEDAAGSRPRPTSEGRHPAKIATVPVIIGQYKSGVSRKCKRPIWQTSYHDHVIRNQHDFEEIWSYIDQNPQNSLLASGWAPIN